MHRHKGTVVAVTTTRIWTRHWHMLAIAGLMSTLALNSPAVLAQQSGGSRFKALPRGGAITAHRKPLSLLSKERVKVVVTMDAESVAEVRARTVGHVISEQDHQSIHSQIARQHAALEPMIVARGGTVLKHYQDAMNGMKIEIARSEIAGLSSLPGVVQVVGVPKYNIKNVVSVPFIGAPEVWQGIPGFRGEHVKIAIGSDSNSPEMRFASFAGARAQPYPRSTF